MINEDRQQIADLSREHDRFMIEARKWLRGLPVSAAPDEGILRRTYDENALVDVPAAAPQASDEDDAALWASLDTFTATVTRKLATLDDALAARDTRIARLEGQIEMLLTLVAGQKKLWVP